MVAVIYIVVVVYVVVVAVREVDGRLCMCGSGDITVCICAPVCMIMCMVFAVYKGATIIDVLI